MEKNSCLYLPFPVPPVYPIGKPRQAQNTKTGGLNAYLEITMQIKEKDRPAAAKVYTSYQGPFLGQIPGALTKELPVRREYVQVLHGFDTAAHAQAYLTSEMFQKDVFTGLKPLWGADPEVRAYTVA